MTRVTRQRRSGWMAQILLGAWVLGLGTGAYGAQFPYPLGDIPLSPEAYQTNLQVIPRERMAEIQAALPSAYNAADQGFVTPANNQGNCGSCWAFAAAGAVESKLLMRGLAPQSDVSEQQQVSCNTEMWGCNGGSMESLLFWAPPPDPDKGPLPESIFPYTASDSTACYNPSARQMPYRVGIPFRSPLRPSRLLSIRMGPVIGVTTSIPILTPSGIRPARGPSINGMEPRISRVAMPYS